MVLRLRSSCTLLAALLCALPATPARADVAKDGPVVQIPLADYLAMVEAAEARQKAAEARERGREAPVAEVVEERIAVRLPDKDAREAEVESFFEVLVQGEPIKALWLPLAGYGASARISRLEARGVWAPAPEAALAAFGGSERGASFVATAAGRYRIEAASRLPVAPGGGRLTLALLKVAAPVAAASFDLPAGLEWGSAGAVLVEDQVAGERRVVRLATQRGQAPTLVARRRFDQGEEKALAHAVVLTLLQLRPEGLRRHDVLLYEVSRGQLSAFEVTLPPGLEVEMAATDEGVVVPIVAGRGLRVERRRQLAGTGYLVLSSTPEPQPGLAQSAIALAPVAPATEVRTRFLAVASALAAEIEPQPAASFSQIDLDDLPPLLGQALGAVDLAAAWRVQDEKSPLALRLEPLPAAAAIAATVLRRDTTTLLTVDGTLLHRESFVLAPSDRPASSFEVELPAGATLWSTKVDDQPTRPLQRAGKLVLPILPRPGVATRVEVVAVLEQAIAPGRSQLEIELARVAAPVLEHSWRLLLPDGPKYRFATGELQPVPAREVYVAAKPRPSSMGEIQGGVVGGTAAAPPPPAVTVDEELVATTYSVDEIEDLPTQRNIRAAPLLTPGVSGKKAKDRDAAAGEDKEGRLAAANYSSQVNELQQGLVGGVKPLPITIPESGKALMLTGVLPPERVSVTVDVKGAKK